MANEAPVTQPTQQAPLDPDAGLPPLGIPAGETSAVAEQSYLDEARTEMENSSPADFLTGFLQAEGLIEEEAPPAPTGTPVQQSPANGQGEPQQVPAGTQGTSPPANGEPQVDPLLAQMFAQPNGGQPPGTQPAPAQPAPVQQQQAPAPQPSPQAPASTPQEWQPFNAAVQIPAELAAAMDHDDPNVRSQAVGSLMAGMGNSVARAVISHIKEVLLPEFSRNTVTEFQTTSFRNQMAQDILEGRPQLQWASPALIQQATQLVLQDEQARFPGKGYTKEVGQRIGQLAMHAMAQLANGGQPFVPQQQQAPAAPVPQQQPPQFAGPPQQGADGNWYAKLTNGQWVAVQPPQQPFAPPPGPSVPWMSGQASQPFGIPQAPAVTPDNFVAGWINEHG